MIVPNVTTRIPPLTSTTTPAIPFLILTAPVQVDRARHAVLLATLSAIRCNGRPQFWRFKYPLDEVLKYLAYTYGSLGTCFQEKGLFACGESSTFGGGYLPGMFLDNVNSMSGDATSQVGRDGEGTE